MPLLRVRGPLRQMAGGDPEHQIAGATVCELLRGLERTHPPIGGWILDERGQIRRHINVFVNGERAAAATAVGPEDRVDILPAISGG